MQASAAMIWAAAFCGLTEASYESLRVKHPRNVLWYSGGPRGGEPDDTYHYDLIYDDDVSCQGELKTPSIRHYILMGSIIDASYAASSQDCASRCYEHAQCASANYYLTTKAMQGQCELLLEKQRDNPRWMLRMPGAVYMEVFCENHDNVDQGVQPVPVPVALPHPNVAKKSNFLKNLIQKLKYYRA